RAWQAPCCCNARNPNETALPSSLHHCNERFEGGDRCQHIGFVYGSKDNEIVWLFSQRAHADARSRNDGIYGTRTLKVRRCCVQGVAISDVEHVHEVVAGHAIQYRLQRLAAPANQADLCTAPSIKKS